ncbi:MAG TPA: hypothetical protein VN757_02515, partial [Steroidobacteraceae bacterium]|nr:hypothetical protein [Steroidobacteraceae bacterium]
LLAKHDNAVGSLEGRFQPALKIQQHPSIFDTRANRLHQKIVIKIVKEPLDRLPTTTTSLDTLSK